MSRRKTIFWLLAFNILIAGFHSVLARGMEIGSMYGDRAVYDMGYNVGRTDERKLTHDLAEWQDDASVQRHNKAEANRDDIFASKGF